MKLYNRGAVAEASLGFYMSDVPTPTVVKKEKPDTRWKDGITLMEGASKGKGAPVSITYSPRSEMWRVKVGYHKGADRDFLKAVAEALAKIYNLPFEK